MANSFQTTQYVLDDVFVRFWNSLSFARTANRNLEADFKNLTFATGQTINYRLEERYLAGEFKLSDFITHTMSLDKINEAFDLMHEGKSIRSVIHY